jgi:hypothetical protein
MSLASVVLWLCAGSFAGFGLLFLALPAKMAGSVELVANTGTARTEVRAMYGGLELGIAAFLVWCALDPELLAVGLVAAGLLLAGIGAGRLLGAVIARVANRLTVTLMVLELGAAAAAFWALSAL